MSVALIATLGDVAAGCWPVIWRVFLVCGGLVALAGTAWWLGERAWQRWQRHRRALAALMDDGDGQGGVPPIARRLRDASAATEAISMRAITAMERLVPACPEFCADLTRPGDGADCTCPAPCVRAWCTRQREQARGPVPATWTEREEGVR